MYIETMQEVMSNTSKVMVDAKGNGNLLMLPLDKLMQQAGAGSRASSATAPESQSAAALGSNAPVLASDPRNRDLMRSRERGER